MLTRVIAPGRRLQNLATVVCALFGIALILNTHPLGDGAWFWYAVALHRGARLYADMHLVLQPLFILQTECNLLLFGEGWLVSKLPAFVEMAVYLLGLRQIAGYLTLRDGKKALLIACAFGLSTLFVAYRFDDYHLPADCLAVYTILLLLRMHANPDSETWNIGRTILLGVFSGLSITLRLNDGAMLFITTLFLVLSVRQRRRAVTGLMFTVAAALTVLGVVLRTGDTVRDYVTYSILKAAGSKGGLSSVLLAPIVLPIDTIHRFLFTRPFLEVLFTTAVLISCIIHLANNRLNPSTRFSGRKIASGILLLILVLRFTTKRMFTDTPAVALSGAWMIIALGFSAIVVFRALQVAFHQGDRSQRWSVLELLLLIPVGQLLSASMSSGGVFFGLYAPVGLFLLLLPVSSPVNVHKNWQTNALMVSAVLILISALSFKARVPFSWHTYVEQPMFMGRQWSRHPQYGPMFISRRQLQFIEPVCKAVTGKAPRPELLSLPYPYANYFCGVTPWHDYIQTFFDTVSGATIQRLTAELDAAPPQWILYQRQPLVIELHEKAYNSGNSLPHRSLDDQIMRKLSSGQWRKVSEWNSQSNPSDWNSLENANWIFIETR